MKKSNNRIIIVVSIIFILLISLFFIKSCSSKKEENNDEPIINEPIEEKKDDGNEKKEDDKKEDEVVIIDNEPIKEGNTYSYWVNFLNIDGSILQRSVYKSGITPSYSGKTPTYYDDSYEYTFTGWDKKLSPVTFTQIYTAQYNKTVISSTSKNTCNHNSYDIQADGSWKCHDCGTLLLGTNNAYITVLSNNQPTSILSLPEDGKEITVGTGKLRKDANTFIYTNSSATKQNLVFKTNNFYNTFEIDANNDSLSHYGIAGSANIKAIDTSSYFEYGIVPYVEIAKGRIVLKSTSNIDTININKKDSNSFDDVIIADAGVKQDNMPELISRDQITVSDTPIKVCTIQELNNDGSVNNSKTETVYAYKSNSNGSTEKTESQNTNINSSLGTLVLDGSNNADKALSNEQKIEKQNESFEEVVSKEDPEVVITKAGETTQKMSLAGFRDKVNSGTSFDGWTVTLQKDIDLDGTEWTPIGLNSSDDEDTDNRKPFAGNFNGNNHKIKGFAVSNKTINTKSDGDEFGLFGCIQNKNSSITIKNLELVDVDIDLNNAGKCVGSLIGYVTGKNKGITIDNIKVSGSVNAARHVGGIIGKCYSNESDVVIKNCENNADVNGVVAEYCGGICGYIYGSKNVEIINCKNNGNITNNGYYVGGLLGLIDCSFDDGLVTFKNCNNKGNILNTNESNANGSAGIIGGLTGNNNEKLVIDTCTNLGNVHSSRYFAGGIVGHVQDAKSVVIKNAIKNSGIISSVNGSAGIIANCHGSDFTLIDGSQATFDISNQTIKCETNNGLSRLAATKWTYGESSQNWNLEIQSSRIVDLVEARDIEISKQGEESVYMSFQGFRNTVNQGNTYEGYEIKLLEDIDLHNTNWTPIGSSSKPFKGNFDGNNKTISNLKINDNTKEFQGLFGFISGSTIKNINIDNADLDIKKKSGILIGEATGDPYIKNINITKSSLYGESVCGGLIGMITSNAIIEKCTIDANVTTTSSSTSRCGGFVGDVQTLYQPTYTGDVITFIDCTFKGEVSGSTWVSSFLASKQGYDTNALTSLIVGVNFINCNDCGTISGTPTYAGGFAGNIRYGQTVYMKDCKHNGVAITEPKSNDGYKVFGGRDDGSDGKYSYVMIGQDNYYVSGDLSVIDKLNASPNVFETSINSDNKLVITAIDLTINGGGVKLDNVCFVGKDENSVIRFFATGNHNRNIWGNYNNFYMADGETKVSKLITSSNDGNSDLLCIFHWDKTNEKWIVDSADENYVQSEN